MCIIVYKPQNVNFPSNDILKTCFNNNPDGAGFMYADCGRVYIHKGFMTYKSFKRALKAARAKTGDNAAYVLHFRISTQAGVNPECTHPYPLSANMDDLMLLKSVCDIGVAHNGIISLTTSYYNKKIAYNDTMLFITDYLSLIIKSRNFYKDADTIKLIDRLCESRLAILDGSGHCTITGDGWTESGGVQYSNKSFESVKQPAKLTSINWSFDKDDNFIPYDKWDKYYNDYTGLYEFTPLYCPMYEDDDDGYCDCCQDSHKCFYAPYSDKDNGGAGDV